MREPAPSRDSIVRKFDGFSLYYSTSAPTHWPMESCDDVEIVVLFESESSQPASVVRVVWKAGSAQRSSQLQQESQTALDAGQVCIVPRQQPRQLQLSQPRELMLIHLTTQFIVRVTQEVLRTPHWRLPVIDALEDEVVSFVAQAMRPVWADTDAIAALYRKALMELLAVHIIVSYAQADFQTGHFQQATVGPKLSPVLAYIHANLSRELKVSALAEMAGLSLSHFCRTFKAAMGITPYQYILSQRILLAKELLAETSLSLSAVSLRCGFYDQSHFILQFRRFTGVTPKAYRAHLVTQVG